MCYLEIEDVALVDQDAVELGPMHCLEQIVVVVGSVRIKIEAQSSLEQNRVLHPDSCEPNLRDEGNS